ncbi:MAG: hypothetical protein M3280_13760 [Actinomycetota bacterium]|nr:hypothetical protein [Actinomycetota bacterium]
MRRLILLASAFAIAILPGTYSAHAQHGTTCGLTGKATFNPGLTVVPGDNGFKFKGKLADCMSSGDVTAGTVTAKGKAAGACEGGTAQGKALVEWNTEKETAVKFSTVNVGALVTLRGKVTKSTEPAFVKGDTVLGELVFEADPSQCASGLKKAHFVGQVGGGSPT